MRFIDLNDTNYEHSREALDWENLAQTQLAAIRNLSGKERKNYINQHTIWTVLYNAMLALSQGKCWYSEAPVGSSHLEVEHFRPKNRATNPSMPMLLINKQLIQADGYWWLAYDWRNLRLAGTLVNKCRRDSANLTAGILGKGSYFPIDTNGGEIAQAEADTNECNRLERVLLLDPTNREDVALLAFDENGEPLAAITQEQDNYNYQRVQISIVYLGLKHTQLNAQRQKIWETCQRYFEQVRQAIHNKNLEALRNALHEIRLLCSPNAPFSKVAWCCFIENWREQSNPVQALIQQLSMW